jgi:hypothetical protein
MKNGAIEWFRFDGLPSLYQFCGVKNTEREGVPRSVLEDRVIAELI